MNDKLKAPKHLERATARWWQDVAREWQLEDHHLRLLTLAAESWDRCQQAREALAEHGTVYLDRFNQPHARPEVGIERDNRLAFVRTLRELQLDIIEPVADPRIARRADSGRVRSTA